MWAIVSLHSSRTISELRQHNQGNFTQGAVTQTHNQDQLTYELNGKEEL